MRTPRRQQQSKIRRILHLFDQSAYVGYMTPFANILIDRDVLMMSLR